MTDDRSVDVVAEARQRGLPVPLRISLIYALVGVLWIVLSDRVVTWVTGGDAAAMARFQTAKGWLFVGVTAVLLYWLVRGDIVRLARANRRLHAAQADLTTALERVRSHADELDVAYRDTVRRLLRACALKDGVTGDHVSRVNNYTRVLCRELGVPADQADLISMASAMHDVGKIAIPDEILLKPGPLTDEEWTRMKEHVQLGADLLAQSRSPLMTMAWEIAQSHHEHWDGSGYPLGLRGEQIPLSGRIVKVADVYDALRSNRPYKRACAHAEACRIILAGDERTHPGHFDPAVLAAFERVHPEFERIFREQVD